MLKGWKGWLWVQFFGLFGGVAVFVGVGSYVCELLKINTMVVPITVGIIGIICWMGIGLRKQK